LLRLCSLSEILLVHKVLRAHLLALLVILRFLRAILTRRDKCRRCPAFL
jgi:hypothetical protein